MIRSWWVAIFLCLLGSGLLSGMAHAQAVATISGTVVDATGASVSGAQIIAHNTGTGVERTASSDSQGHFVIGLLPIGQYTVSADSKGFQKAESLASLEVGQ